MNTFFSGKLGLNIITRQGNEAFLPDDNALVAVTFFEASGLFEVVADGIRRRGQPLCVRAESLITVLDTPKAPQERARINKSKPENYPQNSSSATEPDTQAEDFTCDNSDEKPTAEALRSYKSLHRSWKNCRDKILGSAIHENTIFVSIHPPEKVSFNRLGKLFPKYIRHLKDRYPTEFKGCGAFPEPDADELGWHAHLFPHFRTKIPSDFEKLTFRWWSKAIQGDIEIIDDDFLVDFKYFTAKQQLVKALDYVNPTRGKKKNLIFLYPSGRQLMRYYGEFNKPVTASAPFKIVKEIVGEELISLRRSTEFTDPTSGEVVYSRTALVFDVGKTFLERLREHRNADFEEMVFLASECLQCQRGAPHGTLRKFCDGCICQ